MCGIFGVINFNGSPVDKEKVLSARDILAHRGPDDSGFYESCNHADMHPSVALAHRRLSIIDLSPAAHQPMVSDNGRYVIVFNGEIFNYEEIKSQVGSRQSAVGNKFKTNSDTEVILKLYEQYGAECVNYLRGMFAFAIWDDKEKKLFASRDRFGIKPFYYLHNDNEFIFSSELKAIKHYKNGLTLSMQGMDAFLRTGSVPAPLTIYEETKALLPGHSIEVRNAKFEIRNYWTFTDLIKTHATMQSSNHSLPLIRSALLDSIRSHMVSDVEVGAFLSGGIDSTAIVSLMRQAGHEKIKTISVTFPGNKLDESKYSNLAAKKYETNHFEYRLQEDELINDFDKIIESMDQPTIDGINTYFVSKAAASFGLKVVLSGLGGDELFGGYPSFINIPKYQRIKSLPFAKPLMKAAGFILSGRLPAKAIEYFKNPDAPNAEYRLIRGLFTDTELQSLGWTHAAMHPYIHATDESAWLHDIAGLHALNDHSTQLKVTGLNSLVMVSLLETCVYMRNQLLRDSDVFSMAHSLELRVPFVDNLLYSAVLPYLDSGFDKSFPKKMLVDAVGDLPDEIVHRPKQGFTFPFADWMKHGKIKEAINDSLKKNTLGFDKKELSSMISKFESGKLHWSRVWAMFIASRF
jgi:asparagine synthase (glutamine-hydrolysing)